MIGLRIGSYEVVAKLGAGGMGEVYRARDTKLGRDVAIKVLPDAFASDGDRLARFEREAKTLAALNHPNIAHVYGFEAGALVMELVAGEDLSEQVARGPIAFGPALAIARQIASALEAAHEQGIVHRDLKPGNVKVRSDGTVKVLDFGLAKALASESHGGMTDATSSPTLTARATELGVILGTAAYMAPEQARGKPVDRRADIWAFGVVLFEMLTRRRAFDGDNVSDVLASVLKTEPDWTALPADVPAPVQRLLRRCLEKDPRRRLRDISEGLLQLDEALAASEAGAATPPRRPVWRRGLPFFATAIVTALAVWTFASRRAPAIAPAGLVRFSHRPSPDAPMWLEGPFRDVAISHDGRAFVYTARQAATTPQLYIRAVDQVDAQPLRGAESAVGPFVSPDSQWIGFFEYLTRAIKKVSIRGGPAATVAQVDASVFGATWLTDGTIVFGTATGLKRVSANGSAVAEVTVVDPSQGDASHRWPSAVPGTTIVIFAITQGGGVLAAKLAVVDLSNGKTIRLPITGTAPRYAPTGHIVYAIADGSLRAVPFDVDRREVTGPSTTLFGELSMKTAGAANFDLSDNGTLVFTGGATFSAERSLTWVDHRGQATPLNAPPRGYFYPRVSRDGRVALDVRDQERDIWIWDSRGALRRLTVTEGAQEYGLWTPDAQRVVFTSRAGQKDGIFWTRADGVGEPDLLVDRLGFPNAMTADGKTLIFRAPRPGSTANDIFVVPVDGARTVTTLIGTEHDELNAALSPDNRWIAYQSDRSGRMEIYVRPFPNVNEGQVLISTSGGTEPLWAPDGAHVFYRSADSKLMSVAVTAGRELVAQPPRALFDTSGYSTFMGRNYDITPDGKRFVMVKAPAVAANQIITVVLNWVEELKRVK